MGVQRTRRMRGASLLTAVVLAAMTLSGCSLVADGRQVFEILQKEANQRETLSSAADDLRALEAVESVSWQLQPDGPSGDEVGIEVVAERDVTVPQLVAIATTAGRALTGVQFRAAVALLTVGIDDRGTLTQNGFAITDDQLAAEIAYWYAVENAIGVGLSLSLMKVDDEPPYHREFKPAASSDALAVTDRFVANYPELRATADVTKATSWWVIPGLVPSDLPPAEVIDLLDRVRLVAPLIDPAAVGDDGIAPEGVAVWWQGEEHGTRVIVNQHELRASDWPTVLELARLAIAMPNTSFSYGAMDGDQHNEFRLYTTACDGDVSVEPNDQMLVDALAARGAVLPAGGGPGVCNPAATE